MFYNCNADRSNPECRSFAVFGELRYVESGLSSILFIGMCFLELTALAFITIMVVLMMRIFWNSHSYHINMMLIFKFFVSHVFIYTISSMIILAFQTGYLEVTGDPTHPIDILLLVTSILRYYQLFGCVFMLATFLCERVAATVFIDDYETCNRPHIAVTLLTIVSSCSLLISIQINFFSNMWMDWAVLIGSALIISLTFMLSALLYYRNLRLAENLETKTDSYSLSVRFQLKENFRAFKLLRDLSRSSTIGIVVSGLVMAVAVIYRENKNMEALFGEAFNVFHAISFLSVLLQNIWAEPKWKMKFMTILGCKVVDDQSEKYLSPPDAETIRNEYFEKLAACWEFKSQ
ncbi:sre-20 [Pristionchus pacificus]|uniref:Sre-20 n=1 Tax=Pristionchus pacificus TaxID=54126 RepID=A0A2A6CBJ1_PRIPA|nr:sre-20 [Pristionchus pacificus]|eukprot:PDM75391.1 sre-20 [Pristionchus pacificus]